MFKAFIIRIVGLLWILKHFTDIVKTELIVVSKVNNTVNENMSYYDHGWKYLGEFGFILFKLHR